MLNQGDRLRHQRIRAQSNHGHNIDNESVVSAPRVLFSATLPEQEIDDGTSQVEDDAIGYSRDQGGEDFHLFELCDIVGPYGP